MSRITLKMIIVIVLLMTLVLCGCTVAGQGQESLISEEMAVSVPASSATIVPVAGFTCDAVSEIPTVECQALVTFYEATNGPNWLDDSGWLQTTTPCSWLGVTCTDGHVEILQIFFNNLQGQLPASLADLTQLRVLDLHNNALTGTIPLDYGRLSHLEYLDLSVNQISGAIPETFGDLTALQSLNLVYNELTGPIPATIGLIAPLRNIDLSYNQINGELPNSLADLTALETLRLRDNQLEGAIPFGLGDLANLTEINLTFNQLTGIVPSALYQVPIHRFWGNQVDGTFFLDENGQQDMSYLGAEFTFNQAIADSVFTELVNVGPTDPWPGILWAPPEHIVFTFAGADGANDHAPLGLYLPAEGELLIYPTAGLNAEVQPIVAALQQLLTDQPDLTAYAVVNPETKAAQSGLTMLPPSNAQQIFRAQAKYIPFAEGIGVRYLTQLSQGLVPVNNQELFYTFQGLTANGATYVAAYFPVSLPDLPASNQISDEAFATMMEDWQGYITQTLDLLNEQPSTAYTPDLAELDALINSLSVTGTTAVPQLTKVSPQNRESVESQPVLQWQGYPGAVSYQVIVLEDDAYPPVVVLDQATTETSLMVTPALESGSYSWTVWAYDAGGKVTAELTSNFLVADER